MSDEITLKYDGKIAIITLNIPHKLNALTHDHYFILASRMREVAAREDIYVTILTGTGRYFSAGADVRAQELPTERREVLKFFASNNLELTNAFYTHPKILITALNGPVVGLSAALVSHSDFIYATPQTFLLTPFTSLGLVTEGASSISFVQRLGISKANEALIMSKRITSEELERTGFVNKVFDVKAGDTETFMGLVRKEVEDRLGEHLNSRSLISVKELIRKPYKAELERANLEEVLRGTERFEEGAPKRMFEDVASGRKKHKL